MNSSHDFGWILLHLDTKPYRLYDLDQTNNDSVERLQAYIFSF